MVKAQEWLEKNYPKNGKKYETIFARNKELEGHLTIEGYEETWQIVCNSNASLESIKLKDLPKLTHITANDCQISKCLKNTYISGLNSVIIDIKID